MFHLGASRFIGFGKEVADSFRDDPWNAVNILDDVIGSQNAMLVSPLVAYQAAKAQRGDKLAVGAAGAASLVALGPSMTAAGWITRMIAPTLGGPVGWVATFVGGLVIGGAANALLRESLTRNLRTLRNFERDRRRLETGGWFSDSEGSLQMRQAALAELSGSYTAARSYLGREGMFSHR